MMAARIHTTSAGVLLDIGCVGMTFSQARIRED
jgi:hypothetical protein